jgi:hypothetical protein
MLQFEPDCSQVATLGAVVGSDEPLDEDMGAVVAVGVVSVTGTEVTGAVVTGATGALSLELGETTGGADVVGAGLTT